MKVSDNDSSDGGEDKEGGKQQERVAKETESSQVLLANGARYLKVAIIRYIYR